MIRFRQAKASEGLKNKTQEESRSLQICNLILISSQMWRFGWNALVLF